MKVGKRDAERVAKLGKLEAMTVELLDGRMAVKWDDPVAAVSDD